jgi:hypothetical protein
MRLLMKRAFSIDAGLLKSKSVAVIFFELHRRVDGGLRYNTNSFRIIIYFHALTKNRGSYKIFRNLLTSL